MENNNEKHSTGTKTKLEVAQASEDSPTDEDAPPVLPEYYPDVDDDIKDGDDTTDISVSGDPTPRLSSDSSNYAEVGATSADKYESK